jgi:hypothetical protein
MVLTDATIGAGPYVGYLAGSSERTRYRSGQDSTRDHSIGSATGNDFGPIDAGVRFAGGLHVGRWNLSFAYDMGLSDIVPAQHIRVRTRTFSTSLVLFF